MFIKGVSIEERAPFSGSLLTVSYIVYDESRNVHASGSAVEIGTTGVYYTSFIPDIDGDWTLYMYCSSTGEKHTFHYRISSAVVVNDTHEITTANDLSETTIEEINLGYEYDISMSFDLDALENNSEGGIITIRVYNKPNGSTYSSKPVAELEYAVGFDDLYPAFSGEVHNICKVTIQCSEDISLNRNIPYEYITRRVGI